MKTKSGYVVFLGEPNVGKSSLLNAILKEKIAIVTHKAQTTRKRVAGVYTFDECQIVFLDLPGIHRSHKRLNQFMMDEVMGTIHEADILIWLFDATENHSSILKDAYDDVQKNHPDKIQYFVWTKRDLLTKPHDLSLKSLSCESSQKFLVSAKTGEGIGELLYALCQQLPEGPFYFDGESLTDWSLRDLSAEIIREKCLLFLHDEIPYALTVAVQAFKEEKNLTRIEADLIVEHDSQKGIVIGQGAKTIKKIGMLARPDIEKLLGKKVDLRLKVKVDKNWTKDDFKLREYGYRRD